MKLIRILLLGAAACVVSLSVAAQWQWTDQAGRKVFSDRAPPSDIPEKNIVKRPGVRNSTPGAASAAPAADGSAASAAAAPLTPASAPQLSGVDKELLEKKKKAEEARTAKRKAEQESLLIAKVENCARAKQSKATLDSGLRLVQINEKGEREVLDAAQRAAEAKRVQSIIEADCQ